MDTKNINEIFVALSVLSKAAVEITADGKVDVADAKHVLELLNEYKAFIAAIEDAKEVIDEAKDIDEQEAIQLGLAAYGLVKDVVKSIKQMKA